MNLSAVSRHFPEPIPFEQTPSINRFPQAIYYNRLQQSIVTIITISLCFVKKIFYFYNYLKNLDLYLNYDSGMRSRTLVDY